MESSHLPSKLCGMSIPVCLVTRELLHLHQMLLPWHQLHSPHLSKMYAKIWRTHLCWNHSNCLTCFWSNVHILQPYNKGQNACYKNTYRIVICQHSLCILTSVYKEVILTHFITCNIYHAYCFNVSPQLNTMQDKNNWQMKIVQKHVS